MILYHVTTAGVLPDVLREGVRPDVAQTVRQEVWLVEPSRLFWAFLHVAKRHNAPIDNLVGIRVSVPAAKLTRRGNGLYTTQTLIGPKSIQAVTSLGLKTRRVS